MKKSYNLDVEEGLLLLKEEAKPYDLDLRLKQFVIEVFEFVEKLPKKPAAYNIHKQLVRSASSCGANYRAARRARSPKEYIAKLGIVEEEADEACYWFELVIATGWNLEREAQPLLREANEITAIIVSLIKNVRKRL